MRYVEIPIYKFEELDRNIKEKVLSRFREVNDMPFLEDTLMERLEELLKENSIEVLSNLRLLYSLSHSQGDGVCFTGSFKYKDYITVIEHRGVYYNTESVSFLSSCCDRGDEDSMTSDADPYDEFIDKCTEICSKLEKIGYEIIEYENSEEHIREILECNEYEFFFNGNILLLKDMKAKVSPDRESFNRIFHKARRWLNEDEFHSWLCRCYGAMSVPNGRHVLVKSIEGQIYDLIANRKRKQGGIINGRN